MAFETKREEATLVSSVLSVVTGKPVRISASSAGTLWDCNRKWWYNKVYGLETPGTASTELGGRVHERLEEWLLTGVMDESDKAGRVAAAGIYNLPAPPIAPEQIETMVEGMCGPLPYLGYVDMWAPPPDPVKVAFENSFRASLGASTIDDPESPWIGDHKSTKDWRWAKTSEELGYNPQMLFYAYVKFQHDPPKNVRMSHMYYITVGTPEGRRVDVQVPWERAVRTWERYVDAAETMAKLALEKEAGKIGFTVSACRKYGGCPFYSRCSRSYKVELTEDRKMGIQEKIKALKAKKAGKKPGTSTDSKERKDQARADLAEKAAKKARKKAKKAAKKAAKITGELDPPIQDIVPPDVAPQATITDALLDEAAKRFSEVSVEMASDGLDVPSGFLAGLMKREGIPNEFYKEVRRRAQGKKATPVAELFPDGEPTETAPEPAPKLEAPPTLPLATKAPVAPKAPKDAARIDLALYPVDIEDNEPDTTVVSKAVHAWLLDRGNTVKKAETQEDGRVLLPATFFTVVVKIVVGLLYVDREKGFRITSGRLRGIAKSGHILKLWEIGATYQTGVAVIMDYTAADPITPMPTLAPVMTQTEAPAATGDTMSKAEKKAAKKARKAEAALEAAAVEAGKAAALRENGPEATEDPTPAVAVKAPHDVIPIFVDCAPENLPEHRRPIELETLLGPAMEQVAREENVTHYLAAEFDNGQKGVATKIALAIAKKDPEFFAAIANGVLVPTWHKCHAYVLPILSSIPGVLVIRKRY